MLCGWLYRLNLRFSLTEGFFEFSNFLDWFWKLFDLYLLLLIDSLNNFRVFFGFSNFWFGCWLFLIFVGKLDAQSSLFHLYNWLFHR